VIPVSHSQRGRAAWIGLAALVVLLGGLWLALWQMRPAAPEAPAPGTAEKVPAPDDASLPPDALERALAQAGDSTAIKTRWVDDVQDVDVAALSAKQREVFVRFANARSCSCGCGYTLAGCRRYDSSCETSLPLVKALYDSVRAGAITSATGIRERPPGP
jgi:hypothetical protein